MVPLAVAHLLGHHGVCFDGVFKLLEEHAIDLHSLEADLRFFVYGQGVGGSVVVFAVFSQGAAAVSVAGVTFAPSIRASR